MLLLRLSYLPLPLLLMSFVVLLSSLRLWRCDADRVASLLLLFFCCFGVVDVVVVVVVVVVL